MSLDSRGRSTRQSAIRMVICWGLLFTPPATAAGAFKIGVIYPQKSSSAWAVESFTQVRLAVKRINENKQHHQQASSSFPILEFVAYDSLGESLTALKGAAQLIETDHCNVLIGPAYSTEIPAASAFASVRLPKRQR
jgi:ABC-type branched-subunit amino acid transport system substrate-binding protein